MIEQALNNFKNQYPAYRDWNDEDLLYALHKKYYDKYDYDDFKNAFALKFSGKLVARKPVTPTEPVRAQRISLSGKTTPLPYDIEKQPELEVDAITGAAKPAPVQGSILGKMKIAAERGMRSFMLDQAAYEAALSDDERWKEVEPYYIKEEFERRRKPLTGEGASWIEKGVLGASEMAPPMAYGTVKGLPAGITAASMAALAGQAGLQVATPEELITVPAAFAGGTAVGAAWEWYRQGAGQMYAAMRQQGIDHDIASILGQLAGFPYAMIEFSQASKIIPGLRPMIREAFILSAKDIALRMAKRFGSNWAQETSEEVLQELVQITAEETGKQINNQLKGTDLEHTNFSKALQRLWHVGTDAALSLGLLLLPGEARNVSVDTWQYHQEQQFEKAFDRAIEEQAKWMALEAQRPGGPIRYGETLEEFKKRRMHERINQRAQAEQKKQKEGKKPTEPREKPTVKEPPDVSFKPEIVPERPPEEQEEPELMTFREFVEELGREWPVKTSDEDYPELFALYNKYREGEIDAETIRSYARQIYRGRDVGEGGEAEGRTDIQQPEPGQPGRPTPQERESEKDREGEEAIPEEKEIPKEEKEEVEYLGLQELPRGMGYMVLVNNKEGSTIGYEADRHKLKPEDEEKLKKDIEGKKIVTYEEFMEYNKQREKEKEKPKEEIISEELPPLDVGEDIRQWWKNKLTSHGRSLAVKKAGLKESVAKKAGKHLTDDEAEALWNLFPEIREKTRELIRKTNEELKKKKKEKEKAKADIIELDDGRYVVIYDHKDGIGSSIFDNAEQTNKFLKFIKENPDISSDKAISVADDIRKGKEPVTASEETTKKTGELSPEEDVIFKEQAEIERLADEAKNKLRSLGGIGFTYDLQHNPLFQDLYDRTNPQARRRIAELILSPEIDSIEKVFLKLEESAEVETQPKESEITVRRNEEKDGIEIIFPDKPDELTRKELKNHKFRWSPKQKLWYAKYNKARWDWANGLVERKKPEEKVTEEPEKKDYVDFQVGDLVVPKATSQLPIEVYKVTWENGEYIRTNKTGRMTFHKKNFDPHIEKKEETTEEVSFPDAQFKVGDIVSYKDGNFKVTAVNKFTDMTGVTYYGYDLKGYGETKGSYLAVNEANLKPIVEKETEATQVPEKEKKEDKFELENRERFENRIVEPETKPNLRKVYIESEDHKVHWQYNNEEMISNGKWAVLVPYAPNNLVNKFNDAEEYPRGDKFTNETIENNKFEKAVERGEYVDDFGERSSVWATEDGQYQLFSNEYVAYFKRHIPNFNIRINTKNSNGAALIYSGDKFVGLLMPKSRSELHPDKLTKTKERTAKPSVKVKEESRGQKADERSGVGVPGKLPSGEIPGAEKAQLAGKEGEPEGRTDAGEVSEPTEKTAGRRGERSTPGTRTANRRNYRINPEQDNPGKTSFNLRKRAEANIAAIELLKKLEEEKRLPTDEEKKILIQYVGWGGIPQAFDPYNREYEDIYKRIKDILTPEEYNAARSSVNNAHFTSFEVIEAIWDIVRHLGFKGGYVLEPSMGLGHFFGLMPDDLSKKSNLAGIELDSITGRIASLLYPDAEIEVNGFEKTYLPNNFFDLIISNVPFGDYQLFDETEPNADFNKQKFPIHDFFMAKSIEKLKEGGLLVVITSHYTMDKQSERTRKYLAEKADLIGAIRLPNTAFKNNANTEVVTDILILRKREKGAEPGGEAWQKAKAKTQTVKQKLAYSDQYYTYDISYTRNEYFDNHPEMIMGKEALTGSMYSNNEYTVESDGRELGEAIRDIIDGLPKNIFRAKQTEKKKPVMKAQTERKYKKGSIVYKEGKFYRKGEMELEEIDVPKTQIGRYKAYIKLKDATTNLTEKERDPNVEEKEVEKARRELNKIYDEFVRKYGNISSNQNNAQFQGDPDYYFLRALERKNEEGKYEKAAIFRSRVFNPEPKVEKVDTAKEALIAVLNERGKIDIERMKELSGIDEEQLIKDLESLIYLDPTTEEYVTADEYLSGDVVTKLADAEAAAKYDERYKINVEALKVVQPERVEYYDIKPDFGAGWIGEDTVNLFIHELLHIPPGTVKIKYVESQSLWIVTAKNKYVLNNSVSNTETYGTPEKSALDLIIAALNFGNVTVWQKNADETKSIDWTKTLEARGKLELIKEKFEEWVWEDEERRRILEDRYNERYNRIKEREFDGSHLTFEGMAKYKDGEPFELRDYQKNAVWRIIQTRNALLAHEVGAGKTYEMIAAAMEMKRMGIINKPLFSVPNHLVAQWEADFRFLYPTARILVTSKKDFQKKNRQELLSRIATDDWDAIIIAHTQLEFLPVKDETFNEFLQKQIDDLARTIEMEVEENGRKNNRVVKQLEAAKKRLEARIRKKSAREKKDLAIYFEDLGIDQIFIDEAHMFKNIQFPTRLNIRGVGKSTSNRAMDLFIKTRYLYRQNGGNKGVVFATGTPISNTLSEFFVMQKFLQPDRLEQLGLSHFDAWAHTFGKVTTNMEITAESKGMRNRQGLNDLKNLAELMQIYQEVADIKRIEDLPEVDKYRPKIKSGKHIIIVSPLNDAQNSFIDNLAERAERVRRMLVEKTEDNMLLITTDGRKAVLDMRLIDPTMPDNPDSKINKAVANIYTIWERTAENKSTQLVFLDYGAPGSGAFDLYNDIKTKLIEKGIPENEIAFIHDAKNEAQKEELFKKVRNGEIRILIGSTQKMGAGMNVQDRLIAAHHLDAPWRPADIEQRDGRIRRFGNMHEEIEIYRYITQGEGSNFGFDSYLWQLLETKAKAIAKTMIPNTKARTVEGAEGRALTYAEVKAIASGNPIIMEKIKLDSDLINLEMRYHAFMQQKSRIKDKIANTMAMIDAIQSNIDDMQTDLANFPDNLIVMLDGKTFDLSDEDQARAFGKFIIDTINNSQLALTDAVLLNGKWDKFKLVVRARLVSTAEGPQKMGEIHLNGARGYTIKVQLNLAPLRTANELVKLKDKLEDDIKQAQKILENQKGKLSELNEEIKREFPQLEELKKMRRRKKEIDKELDVDHADVEAEAETAEEEAEDVEKEFQAEEGQKVRPHQRPADLIVEGGRKEAISTKVLMQRLRKLFPRIEFRKKYLDRWRKKVLAKYYKLGLVKSRSEADIDAIAHEIGHFYEHDILAPLKGARRNEIIKELKALDYDDEAQRASEGLAEFLRVWLTGEDTQSIAPKFTEYFEDEFLKRHKDRKSLLKARNLITKFREQGDENFVRAQAGLENPNGRLKRMREVLKSLGDSPLQYTIDRIALIWKRFRQKFDDDAAVVEWLLKKFMGQDYYGLFQKENPVTIYRNFKMKAGAMAEEMINTGVYNIHTGEVVSRGIRQILQDVKNRGYRIDDFLLYLYAKHAKTWLEPLEEGVEPKNPGISLRQANYIIDKYKNDDFDALGAEITKYFDELLKMVMREGGLGESTYKMLGERYPYYIPMMRDLLSEHNLMNLITKRGFASQPSPIKRAKGSDLPLEPMINAWIRHTERMVVWAQKARLMNSLTSITSLELTPLVRKTLPPMEVRRVNSAQLAEKLSDMLFDMGIIEEPIEGASDLDGYLNLFFTNVYFKKNGVPVVSVWRDGKREWYELHPELFKFIQQVDAKPMTGIAKVLAPFARGVRLGATGINPSFIFIRNALKDSFEGVVMSQSGRTLPLYNTFAGLMSEILKGKDVPAILKQLGIDPEMAELYARAGGVVSTMAGYDRTKLQAMADLLVSRVEGNVIKFGMKHPIEGLRFLFAAIENATRIDEFKKVYNKVLNETGDKEEAFAAAARASQDITTDFARSGIWGRELNQIVPFYNAGVQGISKLLRSFGFEKEITGYKTYPIYSRANALKRFIKAITFISGLSFLSYILRDDDEWEKLETPFRYNYFHFWINGTHIIIPAPFLVGALFHGGLQTLLTELEGDPDIGREYLKYLFNEQFMQLLPLPQDLAGIGPYMHVRENKNWRGVPIEPPYARETKAPKDIVKPWTSKTSIVAVNKVLVPLGIDGISPVQFEYLMNAYTGGLYSRLVGPTEYALGVRSKDREGELADLPIVGTLFARDLPMRNKYVNRFYEEYEDMKRRENTDNPHPYAGLIKITYNKVNAIGRRKDLSKNEKDIQKAEIIIENMKKIQELKKKGIKKWQPQLQKAP